MAISKYTNPVQNTLEQYVPLPFQEMAQAGAAIQQRGDLAEQQQMQVETGLGSMEALAPGYSQFRNKFVTDYKTQASALLDKYKGNTSDPDFIRESKRMNLTFAADPRLQTIKQGNELIKSQQKIAQELAAKGVKFIDPNRNFTGVDQNGNLIAPTGSIRGTNFDEDITKSFLQIRDNMIDNGKGWKTNKGNLDRLAGNYAANLETNPVTKDAIDYYTQQGYNPQQARQAALGLVKQAYTDNLRTDRDYAYDQLQLAYAREGRERYEFNETLKAKAAAKKSQGMTGLVPEVSAIDPKNLNKDLISGVDNVLENLNSAGGLRKSQVVTVADTPANRAKYAGKFTETNKYSSVSAGTGAAPSVIGKELRLNQGVKPNGDYNPDHIELLKTAREQLGSLAKSSSSKSGYLADKTVLQRYKDFLKADNAAYTFWNTQSGDQLKQLDNVYVGTKGEKLANATLIDSEGKMIKTANKKFDMADYDGFSFSGISAMSTGDFPNGAIKVSAIDKKNGKIVQFLKPLDPQTASFFTVSNKGYRALTAGKSNQDIAKDRSMYIQTEDGNVLVPQKNNRGGLDLFFIDPNSGKKLSEQSIPFEAYEQEERNGFSQYLTTFSNKG